MLEQRTKQVLTNQGSVLRLPSEWAHRSVAQGAHEPSNLSSRNEANSRKDVMQQNSIHGDALKQTGCDVRTMMGCSSTHCSKTLPCKRPSAKNSKVFSVFPKLHGSMHQPLLHKLGAASDEVNYMNGPVPKRFKSSREGRAGEPFAPSMESMQSSSPVRGKATDCTEIPLTSVLTLACSKILADTECEGNVGTRCHKGSAMASNITECEGNLDRKHRGTIKGKSFLHVQKKQRSSSKRSNVKACPERESCREIIHADSPCFGFRSAINRAMIFHKTHVQGFDEQSKTPVKSRIGLEGCTPVDTHDPLEEPILHTPNESLVHSPEHVVAAGRQGYLPTGTSSYAKDQRAAACFPKQSARDACHSIIDAIHRCNVYLSKKERGMQESPATCTDQARGKDVHPSEQNEIGLDHILSNVPYKDMLQDLFSVDNEQECGEDGDPLQRAKPLCIPVVTKTYEESFMREPMWDYERPCIMGSNCECNFIGGRAGEGFTAVEFILPSEACTEPAQRTRQMCVLCHRRLVQSLFYDIIYAGSIWHPRCMQWVV